ncbi:hypothetical protein ACQ4LE_000345 [Meloidogyne hapla]
MPSIPVDYEALAFVKSLNVSDDEPDFQLLKPKKFNKNIIDALKSDTTGDAKAAVWDSTLVLMALVITLFGFLYFFSQKFETNLTEKNQTHASIIEGKVQGVASDVRDLRNHFFGNFRPEDVERGHRPNQAPRPTVLDNSNQNQHSNDPKICSQIASTSQNIGHGVTFSAAHDDVKIG